MDIVLDIRHNYDLDLQDISELLNFRIAMVPKSWTDQYGDTIRKNGQEISECLNQMLSNNARVRCFNLTSNKILIMSIIGPILRDV